MIVKQHRERHCVAYHNRPIALFSAYFQTLNYCYFNVMLYWE